MIFDDWVRRNEATSEPFPGLGLLDLLEVARAAGGHVAEAETLEELYEQLADWGVDPLQVDGPVERYIKAVKNQADEVDGVTVSSKFSNSSERTVLRGDGAALHYLYLRRNPD